jgi:signal transduction histidine kinase
MRSTDLVEVARELAAEHQERALRHLIQLAGKASLIGQCDRARIERVLDNMVANAIKYSPDGGVVTIACAREVDETGAWALVSVRDSGIGIPPADSDRIFEPFQRATNVGTIAGSGIGLSAARDIVAQHGGMITADSQVDRGTTITVRLPLERCS